MRAVVQKVTSSKVTVDEEVVGQIGSGLLVLLGVTHDDTSKDVDYMIDKITNLRIFEDENGVMNKSFLEVGGSILSISQFTLYADTRKGRRPSYLKALNGEKSVLLYDLFNKKLKDMNIDVQTGKFGADMKVSLVNDGPTTIMLDSEDYK